MKMLRVAGLVLAAMGLVAVPSVAHADPLEECHVFMPVEDDTRTCLQTELNAAESVMTDFLQEAQSAADSHDKDVLPRNPSRTSARMALDQSQVAWVQFRDAKCQIEASLLIPPYVDDNIMSCKIDLTRARTIELEELNERLGDV